MKTGVVALNIMPGDSLRGKHLQLLSGVQILSRLFLCDLSHSFSACPPLPFTFPPVPPPALLASSADYCWFLVPTVLLASATDNEMPTPYTIISGLPGCQWEQLGNLLRLPKLNK